MSVVAPPRSFARWAPIYQFVRAVNAAWTDSTGATSWYRTPAENVRVGGSGPRGYGVGGPLSQHLIGLAVDLVGADAQALRREGLLVIDQGTHVHVQGWPAGVLDELVGL